MKSDLDPMLKIKLREVARSAPPDWPNWKRGLKWGAVTLLPGFALSFAVLALARNSGIQLWGSALGMALIIALCVGVPITFRPQK